MYKIPQLVFHGWAGVFLATVASSVYALTGRYPDSWIYRRAILQVYRLTLSLSGSLQQWYLKDRQENSEVWNRFHIVCLPHFSILAGQTPDAK